MAANPARRLHRGTRSAGPTRTSATPLARVQNRREGGNHGGTMASKNSGLTKCMTPADVRPRPMIVAMRASVVAVRSVGIRPAWCGDCRRHESFRRAAWPASYVSDVVVECADLGASVGVRVRGCAVAEVDGGCHGVRGPLDAPGRVVDGSTRSHPSLGEPLDGDRRWVAGSPKHHRARADGFAHARDVTARGPICG